MNGGYKLIDLKNVNIATNGNSSTIPGVYESIENNYRKPTIITGLVLDGVERSDRFVNFRVSSDGGFVCEIGFNDSYVHLMLNVSESDVITVSEM